jgi:hypothetical protein
MSEVVLLAIWASSLASFMVASFGFNWGINGGWDEGMNTGIAIPCGIYFFIITIYFAMTRLL